MVHMDDTSQPIDSPDRVADRPGLNGKWVLLASALILLIAVPLATWITLRSVERSQAQTMAPLDFSQHEQWHVLPVKWTNLDSHGFLQPPADAPLRDTEFGVSSEQEAEDLRFSEIAQNDKNSENTIKTLFTNESQTPNVTGFYATYLLGQWLTDAEKKQTFQHNAFASAPSALVLRFEDSAGKPIADLSISPIEITFARVINGKLNDKLKLVYPDNVTDAKGRIFLPVYDAPLRVALPEMETFQLQTTWPETLWMTWPGQVGGPKPIKVLSKENEQ